MALVQGWDDTKAALRAWRAAPSHVLRPWVLGTSPSRSLLLLATLVVAELSARPTSPAPASRA